jgi:23S rRNA pseudouridine2605 synthase
MLAKLGHKVMRLRRIAIGPVALDKLPKGKARRASEAEVAELRRFVAAANAKIEKARAGATRASGGHRPSE